MKMETCKQCKKEWSPLTTEQGVAVKKRGYCIGCLIERKETFNSSPNGKYIDDEYYYSPEYEFIPENAKVLPL